MSAPIRLNFAASTSQARTEINALAATVDKLQAKLISVSGLDSANRFTSPISYTDLEKASKKLGNLTPQTVNISDQIKQTESLVDNINKGKISWDEYKKAAGGSSRVVAQQLALQKAAISNLRHNVGGDLLGDFKYGDIDKNAVKPLERLAVQARVTGASMKALGQNYIDVGKNMAFSARQLTISLTAPFTVVSALSMKAYMDAAESLTTIAKLYGGSADGFQKSSQQIKDEARDLAKTMSDTYATAYQDTYEHQKFYAAQGLTGKELAGSTQQAVRLQMLGDVDTTTAQQAITTLTNVYEVNTDRMAGFVDYMNKVEDNTTLRMQDFAEAMPKIAPIIRSFEKDPKEGVKAMAEMLEAGKRGGIQSATEIANAWKSIYTKVARPTEQLKNAWSELGSKNGIAESFMGIVTKNGGDVMAIVKEISRLTADWSDVDKNRLFAQLAGAHQVARMTTFAEQLAKSSSAIKDINAEFDSNPDALAENSRRQMDEIMASPEKRWAQFLNRIRDVGITIGEKVFAPIMTVLESGASVIEDIVNAVEKIPGPLKVAGGILGGFAVALGPMLSVLGAIIQVGGQLTNLRGIATSAIGNRMNKIVSGVSNKKLITKDDKINEFIDDPAYNMKTMIAKMNSEIDPLGAQAQNVAGSLGRLDALLKRQTQVQVNNPTASAPTSAARELRPQDIERRNRIMRMANYGFTGDTMPVKPNIVVPPAQTKGLANTKAIIARNEAIEKRNAAAELHRVEMAAYGQRQKDAKRVADRYKSFTKYLTETPQEVLDSRYKAGRMSDAERNKYRTNAALTSPGLRRIADQMTQGVPKVSGPIVGAREATVQYNAPIQNAINKQMVRDQLGYVSRDLAAVANKDLGEKNAARNVANNQKIIALKEEQVRLNNVLKGTTAGIAEESKKIVAANEEINKKARFKKTSSVVDTLRASGNDYIIPKPVENIMGEIVQEQPTQTKSGVYQASSRSSRKALREQIKSDPSSFDAARGDDYAIVGGVHMTPELWKMADVEITKASRSAEKLQRTHAKIDENASKYVSSLTGALSVAGMLGMTLSGDSKVLQTLSIGATTIGTTLSMVPDLAEKAFKFTAKGGADFLERFGGWVGGALGSGAEVMGAGIVDSLKAKFIGFSGWMSANAGMLMGWGAVFAAVTAAGVFAYKKLSEESRKYQKVVQESIHEAKDLADVIGYAYVAPNIYGQEASSITDDLRKTADGLKEMATFDDTIKSLKGRDMNNESDLNEMRLALKPKAIKILASGGTDADVKKMIKAALVSAGADEATIENFKLNLKLDNPEDLIPQADIDNMKNVISGSNPLPEFQRNIKYLGSLFGNFESSVRGENAYAATAGEEAVKMMGDITSAMSVAEGDAKVKLADTISTMLSDAQDLAVKNSKTNSVAGRYSQSLMGNIAGLLAEQRPGFMSDEMKKAIAASSELQKTLMAGDGLYKDNAEAADAYAATLKQLSAAGINLDLNQKRAISNAIRMSAGMDTLTESTGNTEQALATFAVSEKDVEKAAPKTFRQLVDDVDGFGDAATRMQFALLGAKNQLDNIDPKLNKLGLYLYNLPGSFVRNWQFNVDFNAPDEVTKQMVDIIKGAGQKAQSFGMDFAARQMDSQHQSTLDGIRSAGDASLKSLEGQQKAFEKSMKAQEKALDGKHKAQTKALDKQMKEEQKQFDNQQKDEKKQFDKKQKEDKKLFDKDIERQKKDFDNEWKNREKDIKTYYDAARKYLEDQQSAEDKLDKARQRHADAERKRQEMLNDLANKNVDINVALAGGNLDEAARLMNDASAVSQKYFADAGQSMSDAQSEDRRDARNTRLSGLSNQESMANEMLGNQREAATEAFNENISGQQEAFGDKQSAEAETFQEKLDRQKEEFSVQMEVRKEQLQLQHEQEKEYLAMQREAQQEVYAAQREAIQANTDAALKSAEAVHADRKEKMALELELLKIGSAQTEEQVNASADKLLATYARYGVDLGAEGEKLKDGMLGSFHAGIDQATRQIQEDQRWEAVGVRVGGLIQAGLNAGLKMSTEDILKMITTGVIPKAIESAYDKQNFQAISQGNKPLTDRIPKRAKGGPIFGPGTGTSDSILAKLSNGEHVLTAAEVKALGGHAAVERFRKQALAGKAPAFAKGGSVGSIGATSQPGTSSGLTVNISSTGAGDAADGGILSAVVSDVQSIGTEFDSALSKTAAPAWRQFGDSLVRVKNDSITPTFDAMQQAMAAAREQTTSTTAGVMTPAWYAFGQNLMTMKTVTWDFVMQQMQSGLTSLASGTTDAVVNKVMPAWQQGADHIMNMQNNVIDPMMRATRDVTNQTAANFGTAADQIGVGWDRVKENTAIPVRFAIDTVFNKGLVGMWNEIAGKLDLEPFKEHPLTFATGGVLPGYTPGRDVHDFVSPSGGRLRLSGGEAIMRPEWTKAVGGPAAVDAMNSVARSGGVQGVKKQLGQGAQFATGGVLAFANGGTVDEKIQRTMDRAKQEDGKPYQWGGVGNPSWDCSGLWSGIVSHLNGGPFGGRLFTTHPFEAGNPPAGFIPGLSGPVTVGVGPGHMAGTMAGVNMESASMPKGVHIGRQAWGSDHSYFNKQFTLKEFTGKFKSGGMGGSGAATIDPVIEAAYNKWTEQRDALKDNITKFIEGGPDTVMKAIPGKVYTGISDAMENKIMAAMPNLGGVTLGEYGANAEFYVREIIAAAKERNLDRKAARIAIATALVESELKMWANPVVPESRNFPHDAFGGDRDSVGLFQQRNAGWGTVAQRMNPRASAGSFYNALMRVPNWAGMEEGAAAQAVQISAFPGRYTQRLGEAEQWINRVGWESEVEAGRPSGGRELNRAKSGPDAWFDRGGEAEGVGYLEKRTVHPERVLSPEQTQTFGKMVEVLDHSFGRRSNVKKDTVSSPITGQQYMDKITNLDKSRASAPMSNKEYNPKSQEEITKAMQPIFNAFQSFIQQNVVPGVVKYATDLIQMKTDEERLAKVSGDIIAGIEGIHIPSNNEVNMVFGGTVYGDGHLVQIMEDYKRQILAEVRAISDEAARRVAGK